MNNMRELLREMSKKYLNSFGFQVRPTIRTPSSQNSSNGMS